MPAVHVNFHILATIVDLNVACPICEMWQICQMCTGSMTVQYMRDMTFALAEDSHHSAAREATTPARRGKRYARVGLR